MIEKVLIITHGDTDGVTSAALVKSFYKSAKVYFSHPSGLYNDLNEILKPKYKIFICDIALNEPHIRDILKIFKSYGEKITYIDHHPLPVPREEIEKTGITFVHGDKACAAELTFRYMKLGWEMSRIALYGSIGDYALDTDFVKKALNKWDIKTLFLEAGILILGLEHYRHDHEFKRFIVEELSNDILPSSLEKLVKASIIEATRIEKMRKELPSLIKIHGEIAYVIDPDGSLGTAAFYTYVISGKKVGLAIGTRDNKYIMSLRSNDPRIDLNKALRTISSKLQCSCGGHPHAAGARVRKEDFNLFLELLDNIIYKQIHESI